MEDDAGVSGDGNGSWAVAVLDMMESMESSGGIINAFWLTSPSFVLLVGFSEEVLDDVLGVVFLGHHLTHDVLLDLVSHNSESMLGSIHSFLTGISLGLGSVHQSAVVFVSAVTVKSIFDISMIDHALSDISVEALGESIGVAVRAWFGILGEGVDQSSSVSDDGCLSTGDGVDHLLGGAVEVHGNLLSFFGLSFSLEPVGPLVGVVLEVLPVDGGGDVTMVGASLLDIDSVFQQMSSVICNLASSIGWSEGVLCLSESFNSVWEASIPWSLWYIPSRLNSWWSISFPSDLLAIFHHIVGITLSIPVSVSGLITWRLNICFFCSYFFCNICFLFSWGHLSRSCSNDGANSEEFH